MIDKITETIIESVECEGEPTNKCLSCDSTNLRLAPMFGACAMIVCGDCGHERYIME